ncbi:MAG: alpha/beta hydrolase [Ignavibacteria bacterium]|nr:alpha/beta hydrolase [Ignavibacteria bacterium]
MLIVGVGIILILVILFAVLFFLSPGKAKQLINKNGNKIENSISEKLFININGAGQGIFIKGENTANPVILYLHGGMPDYFLTEKYPAGLEKNFTVVWWEQRGCGISWNPDYAGSKTTIEQLVDDTITLTEYLLKRFDKKKIYLMGHSGGTFLGVNVIDKVPELYEAYIGIAQMSDQIRSEKNAFKYLLDQYEKTRNKKMTDYFKSISFSDDNKIPEEYSRIRDAAMHKLGIGTMRNIRNLVTGLFLPSLFFSEYTISEKYHLWMGKAQSGISQNWNEMVKTNLINSLNKFKVPVYFFHGIYDYTCSYQLAKEYFLRIEAPVKGFYSFNNSAHSPLFEEPEKMNNILACDVINLKTDLADKL